MPIVKPRQQSPTWKLLNIELDGRLDEVVAERRGVNLSWKHIAEAVSGMVEGSVSKSALYEWYPELRRRVEPT